MKGFSLVIISILLTQSIGHEALPTSVAGVLDKILTPLFETLSNTNLSLPLLNLGKIGNLSNLEGSISGGLTKEIKARGLIGFMLKTKLKDIVLRGKYDIKDLNLPKLFPLYGKGDFDVAVEHLSFDMVCKPLHNSVTDKENFTFPTFTLRAGNSKVKFESLMDDPAVTDFLNELISDLVPDLAVTLEEPLLKRVQAFADKYGNGIVFCIKEQISKLEDCIKELFQPKPMDLLPSELANTLTDVVWQNFV